RWAEAAENRLPALAAELVGLGVEVILAQTVAAVIAAKGATTSTPIVMIVNSDPVEGGLVTSFARPGGNVTGFAPITPELAGKRLELLAGGVPGPLPLAGLREPAGPAQGTGVRGG